MPRKRWIGVGLAALVAGYLALWPVSVAPVAWQAPVDAGLVGVFAPNDRLATATRLALAGKTGPEDAVEGPDGRIYVSTHDGTVLRLDADGGSPEVFANTGGRPLGIAMHPNGDVIVADAMKGLVAIDAEGQVTTLATQADGVPIVYADAVDVASDGRIYFSDASTKFSAGAIGDTLEASKLDILEHGGHGRILVHDRRDGSTRVVAKGLEFANGVALGPAQQWLWVCETGRYRVIRIALDGSGRIEPLASNLPGFPDNIRRGRDGLYWVGLVSPRSGILDAVSNWPRTRAMMQRLPAFLRPDAVRFAHLLVLDASGTVIRSLQDEKDYGFVTGGLQTDDYVFVTSLKEDTLARISASGAKD